MTHEDALRLIGSIDHIFSALFVMMLLLSLLVGATIFKD